MLESNSEPMKYTNPCSRPCRHGPAPSLPRGSPRPAPSQISAHDLCRPARCSQAYSPDRPGPGSAGFLTRTAPERNHVVIYNYTYYCFS